MNKSREFLALLDDDEWTERLRSLSKAALLRRDDEFKSRLREILESPDWGFRIAVGAVMGEWWIERACVENSTVDRRRLIAWCASIYPSVRKMWMLEWAHFLELVYRMMGIDGSGADSGVADSDEEAEAMIHAYFSTFLFGANPWRDDLWGEMLEEIRERSARAEF